MTQSREYQAPLAMINGQAMTTLPKDLYIPPEAMEVFLEAFEGPLDLLLYLIKKQNLDILEIPIAEVTRQYMEYVELMKEVSLELAAEYLVMAAILAEVKSRMLLPRPATADGIEEDPRAELIRRLMEYERIKKAAEKMDQLPRHGRDTYAASIDMQENVLNKPEPTISLQELMLALSDVMNRVKLHKSHDIQREPLSVQDRMTRIISALQDREFVAFNSLFTLSEGRLGVVVTFLAMLELLKDHIIEFIQTAPFSPIHIKAVEQKV